MTDYTAAELEALAELATTTLFDNWHSWSDAPSKPCAVMWRLDADLAMRTLDMRRRCLRLQRACRSLHRRGLVERRRFDGLLGPGYWYRLIPELRDAVGVR